MDHGRLKINIIEAKIVLLLAEFGNGHQDRSLFYGRCHLLLSTKIIHHQIADKKTLFAFFWFLLLTLLIMRSTPPDHESRVRKCGREAKKKEEAVAIFWRFARPRSSFCRQRRKMYPRHFLAIRSNRAFSEKCRLLRPKELEKTCLDHATTEAYSLFAFL